MNNHLENLKVLTKQLPSFPPAISETPGFKEHEMICGTSFCWDLLDRKELSCAHWFNSLGSEFPTHFHNERKWLIVFKGSMILTIEGKQEERLLVGQWKVIEPNVKHSIRFMEDCHYLAIVIPKTKDWPQTNS